MTFSPSPFAANWSCRGARSADDGRAYGSIRGCLDPLVRDAVAAHEPE